jgi:hypothetical protein
MRSVDIGSALALISLVGLLSGCPKKDTEAAPEPTSPGAATPPTSDKAGAEAPAAPAAAPAATPEAPAAAPATPPAAVAPAAKKKKDDGGW